MNVTRLRSWVRRSECAGVLVAGCWLGWHYLRTKRRYTLLLLLAVACLLGGYLIYRRSPLTSYSHATQRQANGLYLMDALDRNDTRAALAALEAGADPNYRQQWLEGETPIIAAARTGNLIVTKVLIAKGANINAAETGGGGTALHAAIWSSPKITKALLQAGANPNASYMAGVTALMRVAECDDEKLTIFNLLLQYGADIRARDDNGVTVLMHAASKSSDRVAIVKKLLTLGADVRAVDHDGKTALDHAKDDSWHRPNEGCIEALTQAGAKSASG